MSTVDKWNLSKITCILMGISSVFGYSAFYGSADYFKQEYGNNYPDLMFYIVLLLNVFNFFGIVLLLKPFISITTRTYVLFSIMAILFLLIPPTEIHTIFHDSFSIIIICIVASFGGFVTGTMCTTSCSFAQFLQNDIYIKYVIVGTSSSSVIGCVLRLITKLFFNINQGAWIYFITSAMINIIAVIIFYINNKTQFIQYHMNTYYKNKQNPHKIPKHTATNVGVNVSDKMYESLVAAAVSDMEHSKSVRSESKSHAQSGQINSNLIENEQNDTVSYLKVVYKLKYFVFSMFMVYFLTYIIYPSFIQDIPSQYSMLNDGDWMALLVTFLFSIADVLGRRFLFFKNTINDKTLCLLSLLRIVFIPVVLLFYKGWITNDIELFVITIFIGMTNGYITSLGFVKYPIILKSNEHEIGAAIIQFALATGLTLGSFVAIFLVSVMS
eukprot:132606_1